MPDYQKSGRILLAVSWLLVGCQSERAALSLTATAPPVAGPADSLSAAQGAVVRLAPVGLPRRQPKPSVATASSGAGLREPPLTSRPARADGRLVLFQRTSAATHRPARAVARLLGAGRLPRAVAPADTSKNAVSASQPRPRGRGSSPGLLVLAALVLVGLPLAAIAALLTLLVGGHFLTNLGLVAAGALALALLGLLVAALRHWLGQKK